MGPQTALNRDHGRGAGVGGECSCHMALASQLTSRGARRTAVGARRGRQQPPAANGHYGVDQIMSASYLADRAPTAAHGGLPPASPVPGAPSRSANALSARIASVLSASYADLEIRQALETLDARRVQNTAETRRQLRLDVQKEVIECNGEIVKDFGRVAEVCLRMPDTWPSSPLAAIETHRHGNQEPEQVLR